MLGNRQERNGRKKSFKKIPKGNARGRGNTTY